MVHQSDVLKQFLAGTYSNQILHLSSFSESEDWRFKKSWFPKEKNNYSTRNFTLKYLKIKLWFTIFFFCVDTTTIHFLVPNST